MADAPEPPVVTPPPRTLPTFPDRDGPRMLAIVGGTLRYDKGCFFVGGEGEGDPRLVIWPQGMRAGEDSSGPYVDTGVTRLRPGEVFVSGGGEVHPGELAIPEDCRTERVVIAYGPRRPDPSEVAPPSEPPPPPAIPPAPPPAPPVPAPSGR